MSRRRPKKTPGLLLGPLPVDIINDTIGTELDAGEVMFSRAAQAHAARRHPVEYPICQPHLASVVCEPLYIGDDHRNPGKIELIRAVPAANSFVLVAVSVEKDEHGHYNVCSFYTLKKEQVDGRRNRGFLKIAAKAKGPR